MLEREVPPHRSKKDRRRWCGGHVGREHVPTIQVHHLGRDSLGRDRPCDLSRSWWPCWHEEVCARCGKRLRWTLPVDECPVLSPRDDSNARPAS